MPSKKIRVLFIIPTLDPGGLELYLYRFLIFVKSYNNITAVLLVRSNNRGALRKKFESVCDSIYFQPLGYANPKRISWYYNFLKGGKFDTICDFNGNFAGIPITLAKWVGIKNRITFYRQGRNHFVKSCIKIKYNAFVRYLVQKNSSLILSNSKSSIDYFFPNLKKDLPVKVIYNGFDHSQFSSKPQNNSIKVELGIPEDAFVICHSGRFDPAKNHMTILKVAAKLISENNEIYFIICGLNTEKLIKELNNFRISENVKILGYRKDVSQILGSSNLFYFPSITEGQPNSLIEAILAGLPIVTSNIPPIREIIPEGMGIRLLDPLDIEGQVNEIKRIMSNYDLSNAIKLQNWAKTFFSSELRFNEFYKCL